MAFSIRIDISRCVGCRACEVACVTANDLDPEHSRNWVPHLEAGSGGDTHATFAPYTCMHCEDPPCVPACPTGASYKAADGRVLVDKELCIGCGLCVPACPYEARFVDPATKTLDKCTLCDGRVQQGIGPACCEVCPAEARLFQEEGVSVGDVATADQGHKVMRHITEGVNPRPTLQFSGRPEDLELLKQQRPPKRDEATPATLWRNGAGFMVQGFGLASMMAMAGMLGLRVLRSRTQNNDLGAQEIHAVSDEERKNG
jgi:tetrathionate reductase subunit B